MIALALASENIASAVEAERLDLRTALEYNVRLHHRHQMMLRAQKGMPATWQ